MLIEKLRGDNMAGRFNYVKYSEKSIEHQEKAKKLCEELEAHIESLKVTSDGSRPISLALTALEETYMWIGKAIRDNQVAGGVNVEHVAERSNE